MGYRIDYSIDEISVYDDIEHVLVTTASLEALSNMPLEVLADIFRAINEYERRRDECA